MCCCVSYCFFTHHWNSHHVCGGCCQCDLLKKVVCAALKLAADPSTPVRTGVMRVVGTFVTESSLWYCGAPMMVRVCHAVMEGTTDPKLQVRAKAAWALGAAPPRSHGCDFGDVLWFLICSSCLFSLL